MINYGLSAPNSKVLQSVLGVLQNGVSWTGME